MKRNISSPKKRDKEDVPSGANDRDKPRYFLRQTVLLIQAPPQSEQPLSLAAKIAHRELLYAILLC